MFLLPLLSTDNVGVDTSCVVKAKTSFMVLLIYKFLILSQSNELNEFPLMMNLMDIMDRFYVVVING
jgi:hypothetical protein